MLNDTFIATEMVVSLENAAREIEVLARHSEPSKQLAAEWAAEHRNLAARARAVLSRSAV